MLQDWILNREYQVVCGAAFHRKDSRLRFIEPFACVNIELCQPAYATPHLDANMPPTRHQLTREHPAQNRVDVYPKQQRSQKCDLESNC
jgi:hypothetical protein